MLWLAEICEHLKPGAWQGEDVASLDRRVMIFDKLIGRV